METLKALFQRLMCKLGEHDWNLFTIREIEVCPGEFIAHRWCKHCPAQQWADPDPLPSSLIDYSA